jgi:hypothetical protein
MVSANEKDFQEQTIRKLELYFKAKILGNREISSLNH